MSNPDQCHTAKMHIKTGAFASQFLCCKLSASITATQKGAKVTLQSDPAETAIFNRLYEARDAIASSSGTLGPKARVDRRLMAVKIVEDNTSTVVAKLVDSKIRWLPSLWKLDSTPTKDFMMETFGI